MLDVSNFMKLSNRDGVAYYLANVTKEQAIATEKLYLASKSKKDKLSFINIVYKGKDFHVSLHQLVFADSVRHLDDQTWDLVKMPNITVGVENQLRRWIYAFKGTNDIPVSKGNPIYESTEGVVGHYGCVNLTSALFSNDYSQLSFFQNSLKESHILIFKVEKQIERQFCELPRPSNLAWYRHEVTEESYL